MSYETGGTVWGGSAPSSGTAQVALPGYLDFTGAVWGCHFDAESAGTWTAEVGNDVVRQGAAATCVLTGSARPVATMLSGHLLAAAQANLINLGDSTIIAVYRAISAQTGGTQFIASVEAPAFATANDNACQAMLWSNGNLAAFWEQGFGTDVLVDWSAATGANLPNIGSGWHVLSVRRDATALNVVHGQDDYLGAAKAYTNNPTGGTNGQLSIGARTNTGASPLLSGQLAGVGVWDSYLTDAEIFSQVDRVLSGAAKV